MIEDVPQKTDNVPVCFIRILLETAEEYGYELEGELARLDIERSYLNNKSNQISWQKQQDVIGAVVARVEIPGFGLLVGQRVSILDWGTLGYAFISSPNLRKAYDTFSTFQRLNCPMLNLYCLEFGGEGVISAVEAFPLDDLYLFAYEEWLGEHRVSFDRFDIVKMEFSRVNLAYQKPAHYAIYEDMFQCEVRFGQESNSIHFPSSALDLPFNMADEVVAELCIRQCKEVLKHLVEDDPIVDAVRRVLLSNWGVTPTLAIVAEHLNLSARTMRRRLQEAGTSYKDVLSSVRLGLAAEYLRSSQMAPKQIAYLLGYSGASSFHRAFKNQFDKTPSEFRAQFAGGGQ